MATVTIDVDAESKKLDERWQELSDMALDPPGPSANDKDKQRARINLWKADILTRQDSLDTIKQNNGAAKVVVKQVSKEDAERATLAMQTLSVKIQHDAVFQNVINAVTVVLTSADTLIMTAS